MAIESLFGGSIADVQELRRQQAEQGIAAAGQEFGAFRPLYQAGLRFGEQAATGINTLFGAQDPMLKKATDLNRILSQYQDQDLTNSSVLGNIARDLTKAGYAREAMATAQEASKAFRLEQAEGRAQAGEERAKAADIRAETMLRLNIEKARQDEYKTNPRLMLEDAANLPEDDPRRKALIEGAYDAIGKAKADQLLREAQTEAARAQAEAARVQARTAGAGKISTMFVSEDAQGKPVPLTDLNGKLYMPDGSPATNVRLAKQSDLTTILGMQGGATTPGGTPAAGDAQAQAQAALERQRKARQREAGSQETTIGPTGQAETRIVAPSAATAKQINDMTVSEFQEYNRTGKIPERLMRD